MSQDGKLNFPLKRPTNTGDLCYPNHLTVPALSLTLARLQLQNGKYTASAPTQNVLGQKAVAGLHLP